MAANPNTIPLQTVWTREYQDTHAKIPVYPAVTNYRLKADLKKGNTVKRTYARQFIANDMGGGGEFVRQTLVDTEETLVINKEKETSFYVKDLDLLQSHLPTQERYARGAAMAIHEQIDADVLAEYANMNSALDNASFGGSASDGIVVSSSNVTQLFSNSSRLLQKANILVNASAKFTGVKLDDMAYDSLGVALISPEVFAAIIERLDGKNSQLGDKVGVSGQCGTYMGYNLFVTNSLTATATLAMSVQPIDADTVTINGIVFTFKDTVDAGVTAGQVEIGSTVDVTRATLTNLINNPATTVADGTVGQNALSTTPDANGFSPRDKFNKIVATNDNSADTIALVAKGAGNLVLSSTFTSGSNLWTAARQIQHCLIGVANGIDLVIQKEPSVDIRKRDGFVGQDIVTWAVYGVKTFNDGKAKLVDVKVATSAYTGTAPF